MNSETDKGEKPVENVKVYNRLPKRYVVAVLLSVGFFLATGMRTNLTAAYVYFNDFEWRAVDDLQLSFVWPTIIHQWCIYSFTLAEMISLIVMGFLTFKFSANSHRIFGIAIAGSSVLHLFLPVSVDWCPPLIVVINVLKGILEASLFPAFFELSRCWASTPEATILTTIPLFGWFLGQFSGHLIADKIMKATKSWSSCFYVGGVLSLLWSVFWLFLTNKKSTNRLIISEEHDIDVKTKSPGWKTIFKSTPVYANITVGICCGWNVLFIPVLIPQWSNTIATLSAMSIMVILFGITCDYLKFKYQFSATFLRKVFVCSGLIGNAILFSFIVFYSFNIWTFYALCGFLFCISHTMVYSAFMVNHLDIVPRRSSWLIGISISITMLTTIIQGIIKPTLSIFDSNEEMSSLNRLYIAAIIINSIGGLVYAIFGCGKNQKWTTKNETSINNNA
ncbi:hypothetical protein CHUAL_005248 [Chamberlinius hualienensis]